MSKIRRKYKTAYQRARAKAIRLGWQTAAATGHVSTTEFLKAADSLKPDTCQEKSNKPSVNAQKAARKGYNFRQISKRNTQDGFTLSFQFFSEAAKSQFIVQAFYYKPVETFMIKFFNKSHKSLNKYAIRTNLGDFPAILRTNFDILVYLCAQYPQACFGFMGERSFFKDRKTKTTLLEPMACNQRYRIYRLFLHQPGRSQWLRQHYQLRCIENLSTYFLVNHKELDTGQLKDKQRGLMAFFASTFPELDFSDL